MVDVHVVAPAETVKDIVDEIIIPFLGLFHHFPVVKARHIAFNEERFDRLMKEKEKQKESAQNANDDKKR